MKKIAGILTLLGFCFGLAGSAAAQNVEKIISPHERIVCQDAESITLQVAGKSKADRANANALIWRSSIFATHSVSLGPSDEMGLPKGSRQKPDLKVEGKHYSKGKEKVTLTRQPNFSRGDSLGDISGEVRITNMGTVPLKATCRGVPAA